VFAFGQSAYLFSLFDVTVTDALSQTRQRMKCMSGSFLWDANLKFLVDMLQAYEDMVADQMADAYKLEMWTQIIGYAHLW